MDKTEQFRHIYAIILGVFTVAVGIAIICVAADIYYSYGGYTREIAGDRLLKLAIPCVLLIAAIIVGAIFPLVNVKIKPRAEDAVRKLASRMPTDGEGEDYTAAVEQYRKTRKIRLIVWLVAMCIALAAAVVLLWYLIDTSHFTADFTTSILGLVKVVMPVTAVAFIALAAAAVYNGVIAKKQLAALKAMIKSGNGVPSGGNTGPAFIAAAKSVINNNLTVWIVRGVLLVLAIVFIVLGVFNGGATDVLIKATKICTECIGLG